MSGCHIPCSPLALGLGWLGRRAIAWLRLHATASGGEAAACAATTHAHTRLICPEAPVAQALELFPPARLSPPGLMSLFFEPPLAPPSCFVGLADCPMGAPPELRREPLPVLGLLAPWPQGSRCSGWVLVLVLSLRSAHILGVSRSCVRLCRCDSERRHNGSARRGAGRVRTCRGCDGYSNR